MAVDFSGLVLAPCLAIFGEDIVVTPTASRPGAAPYAARGIYLEVSTQIELADGQIMSSAEKKCGLRLADFTIEPRQGDTIFMRGARWAIDDTDQDGQGGMTCDLKEIRP